ncbi:MAG: DUF4823 domain-containing protein [Gammaproteobacteria bacterium]
METSRLTRTGLWIALVILAAGCSAKHTQRQLVENTAQLNPAAAVFISVPENGSYNDKPYPNSGRQTATALEVAFSEHAAEVTVSDSCMGKACLENVDVRSHVYYVEAQIVHWEDRATEWSGIPDRLEVKITVYETSTGKKLSSVLLEGKSKWMTMGGDHPQDLLDSPLKDYVGSLY